MSTEASAVADIVRQAQRHETHLQVQPTELLVFPDKTIIPLEKHADRPRRKRASVQLDDAASFGAYVESHAQPGTVIFGRADTGQFVAVIDYHEGNLDLLSDKPGAQLTAGMPAWGEHRATFKLQATPEWQRWMANNEKPMTQQAFSEFLEDSLPEIQKPAGVDMMEIAQTLSMKTNVAFGSSVRLKNGQVQLQYVETIDQRAGESGAMEVPSEMELAIQPFVGGPRYQVRARLRTKCVNRAVQFTYLIDRPHKIVATAFEEQRLVIETDTGLTVLMGALGTMGL